MHAEIVWWCLWFGWNVKARASIMAFVRTLQRAANNHHFKHQETNNQTKKSTTNLRRKIASAQQFQMLFFASFFTHDTHGHTQTCTFSRNERTIFYNILTWLLVRLFSERTIQRKSKSLMIYVLFVCAGFLFAFLLLFRICYVFLQFFFCSVSNVYFIWKAGKL